MFGCRRLAIDGSSIKILKLSCDVQYVDGDTYKFHLFDYLIYNLGTYGCGFSLHCGMILGWN